MSDAPAPKKRKWKDTLHLPKTDFAMRSWPCDQRAELGDAVGRDQPR